MSALTIGEVELVLNGEVYNLKVNLRSMSAIDSSFGGLGKARQTIMDESVSGIVTFIRLAAGIGPARAGALEANLFANGLTVELFQTLFRYFALLQSGGRPPPEDAPAVDGSAEGNASA